MKECIERQFFLNFTSLFLVEATMPFLSSQVFIQLMRHYLLLSKKQGTQQDFLITPMCRPLSAIPVISHFLR